MFNPPGVAIFAKAFMGIPAQQAAKITRPLMPSAAPAVLLHSLHTQQGVCNIVIAMTRRDFGKPAFSLRKKRFVKTHALSLLGTTRLLSRSERTDKQNRHFCSWAGLSDGKKTIVPADGDKLCLSWICLPVLINHSIDLGKSVRQLNNLLVLGTNYGLTGFWLAHPKMASHLADRWHIFLLTLLLSQSFFSVMPLAPKLPHAIQNSVATRTTALFPEQWQ